MARGIALGLTALIAVTMGWWSIPLLLSVIGLLWLTDRLPSRAHLVLLAAVAAVGLIRHQSLSPPVVPLSLAGSTSAIGKLENIPTPVSSGLRATMHIESVCTAGQCVDADFRVLVYLPPNQGDASKGDRIEVRWRTTPLTLLDPDYAGFVSSQGAAGTAFVTSYVVTDRGPRVYVWLGELRATIGARLAQVIPGDAGALANGMVTGDDAAMADDLKALFRATGLSHITSVSGQNITIMTGFIGLWLGGSQPPTRRRALMMAGMIALVWWYALLVGLEPPALRAAIMASLMMLSKLTGRTADPITILCLAVGAMAMWNPLMTTNVSFWLSGGTALALCLVMPITWPGWKGAAGRLASGQLAASAASVTILLATFHQWSPISLIANAIVNVIATAAFPAVYLLTFVLVFLPWVGGLIAPFVSILLDFIIVVARQLGDVATVWNLRSLTPAAMLLIAAPCLGVVALVSDDGARWAERVRRRWRTL